MHLIFLFSGYCRELQINPCEDIIKLCIQYFISHYFHVFTFNYPNMNGIIKHNLNYNALNCFNQYSPNKNIIDINVYHSAKKFENDGDIFTIPQSNMMSYFRFNSAIGVINNIKLPKNILNKLKPLFTSITGTQYSAIYKFGGYKNYPLYGDWNNNIDLKKAQIIIFDSNKLNSTIFSLNNSNETNIKSFELDLPPLPKAYEERNFNVLYSSYYNSFFMFSYRNDTIFKLSFDINKEWIELDGIESMDILNQTSYQRSTQSLSCFIGDSSKIFFLNRNSTHGCWTYNFETKIKQNLQTLKLTNLGKSAKCSLDKSSIYYDQYKHQIYVGGGKYSYSKNIVNMYNIDQNHWNKLPETNHDYINKPLIWTNQNFSPNVLCIAGHSSTISDIISNEYIDLRDQQNKWKDVDKSMHLGTYFKCPQMLKYMYMYNYC